MFSLEGSLLEPDAEVLASLLGHGHGSGRDPFWADTASGHVAGVIAYIAACQSSEGRNMKSVRDMLYEDDVDYAIVKLLDEKKASMPPFAYAEMLAYLQHAENQTRPSVLSTARTFLKAINTSQVIECMETSTVSLRDVVSGRPQTIFVTIPPEKLKSHRCLLKVWIAVLLTAVMRRKEIPAQRGRQTGHCYRSSLTGNAG